MSLEFEWDEEKEKSNFKKHGIHFELAANIFYDDNRIEIFDEEHSADEDRYITIGLAGDILFVVYTERTTKIRLISARYASNAEKELYYDNL